MSQPISNCHCTIIPPHMSEKVKDASEDDIREIADHALLQHQRLRAERALFFRGEGPTPLFKTANNQIVKVYNAKHEEKLPGVKILKPSQSKDIDAKEAYEWALKTHEFYQKVFDRNSINSKGMVIKSSIHFGVNYDNAFWNGNQMSYGDGDGKIFTRFTIDSDVAGHEMTHGVTQFDINLEYLNQSGALNESLSDDFGSMVKQYIFEQTVDQADWLIGKDLLIGGKWALRSMKAPGTAYVDHPVLGTDPQPATMDAYVNTKQDNGGVHINSGIPNHAFYLAAVKLFDVDSQKYAHSWDGAGRVWYDARRNISPTADFSQFADATIKVADKMFGQESEEAKAIRYAWSEVKIFNHKPANKSDCILC